MAFELTYTNLGPTVLSYLQNKSVNLESQLDTFIMMAQRRLAKDSKTLGVEDYLDGSLIPNSETLMKPTGWRDTLSFTVMSSQGVQTPLLLRSYEYCVLYNASANAKGFPLYYADFGFTSWTLAPVPDQKYGFRAAFYRLPPLIDKDMTTNWFTQNAPECLIYATLYETACYLKDDARMATWFQMYSQALESLNSEDARRREDRFVNRAAD